MAADSIVTGRTRVIFMIGHPVAQTRAPSLFNHHFREVGVDRIVAPLALPAAKVGSFFDVLRALDNCDGIIATIPLKPLVFAAIDRPSERAQHLGLVNVVRREANGLLAGDMTDGPGFWNAAAKRGVDPVQRRIALAGAGAAATAIGYEFLQRGGQFVLVVTGERLEFERLARVLGPDRCACASRPRDLAAYDMAINATPLGMAQAPGTPFPKEMLASLPTHALVADAVNDPLDTQLLSDARALGLATMNGEEMTRGGFRLLGEFLGVF